MDDDCGSAVAEVVECAGGVHPGRRLDPGEPFGRDDLGEGGDHPVAAVLAEHQGLEPPPGWSSTTMPSIGVAMPLGPQK